ncbi:MAG: disulfide bond formation protein B [Acidiphilium sp.]
MRTVTVGARPGISSRRAALLLVLAALFALGMAYFAEYALRMIPCPLCYIERWPYRIAVVLGLLAMAVPSRLARPLLLLAALVMIGDAAIAFVHVGAEQHWWASPLPECNAPPPSFGSLPLRPSASCDSPVFLIPGLPISFATMDLIWALAIAGAIGIWLRRGTRRMR